MSKVLFYAALMGLVALANLLFSKFRGTRQCYITKNRAECAQIMAGRVHHGAANTLSTFEARARANIRLSYAFGIDNAFTTEKCERYNAYRNLVGALLRPDWDMVARDAKGLVKSLQYPQNVVCLVQSFVLKMTISLLYQRDPSALNNEDISFVAAEINRIWIQSKVPRKGHPWVKQNTLHKALGQLIPGCDPLDPQTNPMNLILPAFETMWRVVLRCFIEVRFRGAKEMNVWVAALKAYLEKPDLQQHSARGEEEEISVVSSIVREALRLYPPTRHVHRQFEFASGPPITATADIEGLHRDTEIWGPDADCFRPSRWASIGLESELMRAWMPFGGSPFTCPAKPDFAPRFIGILVATLVEAFCDEKYEVGMEGRCGQTVMAEFHGPLRSERDSYEELFLEVNAPCGCGC